VRKLEHCGQTRQRFKVCLRRLSLWGRIREAAGQHRQQRARLAALGGKHAELVLIVRDDVKTIADVHQPARRAQVTRTSRCRRETQGQLA
jgi:ABC-type xylose transport system substrate-binding protein